MAPKLLLFLLPCFICFQLHLTYSQQIITNLYIQDWSHNLNFTQVPTLALVLAPSHVGGLSTTFTTSIKDIDRERLVSTSKSLKRKRSSNLFRKRPRSRSRSRSRLNKVNASNQKAVYHFPLVVHIIIIYFLKLFLWGAKKTLQKGNEEGNSVIHASYSSKKFKEA